MDILMVSPELAPFARSSEAGDAVASLSKALRQLGHEVTVALPRYGSFESSGLLLARRLTPLSLPGGGEVPLFDGQLASGVQLVLFDAPALFDHHQLYAEDGKDPTEVARRAAFLSVAGAGLIRHRAQQGKAFDVVHLHDWPAALVPLVLRAIPGPAIPTILTIHDGRQQGVYPTRELTTLGALAELIDSADLQVGNKLNFLTAGVGAATRLTTVSAHYAQELALEEFSGPLAPALEASGRELTGITHGIDYALCNPATDTALTSRYDAEDTTNKARCKTQLLRQLNLELELQRPLVAIVGPIARDKGFDIVVSALSGLLKNELTLVGTGAVQPAQLEKIGKLRADYPTSFAWVADDDAAGARRACAAADIVIVPNRSAPCGTTQLLAQRYGAVPVAYAKGGVVDTIVDCDAALEAGTGFLYDGTTGRALVGAVQRALAAYRSASWPRLVHRCMRLDVGWDRPARRYVQVYKQALAAV